MNQVFPRLTSMLVLVTTLFAAVFISPLAVAQELEVTIDTGAVKGKFTDDIRVFKNIPFAAPPVGDLRWRPPQRPEAWDGVRDSTEFGAYCPQDNRPGYTSAPMDQYEMSEDCLTLNVWSPAPDATAKLPVMVWILPGSFRVGSPQMTRYQGTELAKQGVIVVTFSYRMGFLGQFAHPALAREQAGEMLGNYGLMDQVAALEWVQRNIGQFGGDADNVTIFGMSAGGVSVNYLMAVPATKGLFARAISQSSAIRLMDDRDISKDKPSAKSLEHDGDKMAHYFEIEGTDKEVVSQLRSLTPRQVLDYQNNPKLVSPGSLNPVVDGKLVVEPVGKTFREGREHPVPYLSGATSWEGSLLTFLPSPDPLLGMFQMSREDARMLYGDLDDRGLINALEFDIFFGTQRYLVKQHAISGHLAYLYYFNRILEAHKDELPGAGHGAETPYVFKTLDALKPPADMKAWGNTISPSDIAYSKMVSAIWVQFAKTGNPNGAGLPEWPTFTADNDVLLEFAQDKPIQRENFEQKRMQYFETKFDKGEF